MPALMRKFNFQGFTTFQLMFTQETLDRLSTTCFRGPALNLAGNFSRWNSAAAMLDDNIVKIALLRGIDPLLQKKLAGTHRIRVDYPRVVGWTSTAQIAEQLDASKLEERPLNKKSSAKFVISTGIFAPVSSCLTFVVEIKFRGTAKPLVLVWSVYPGEDVGPLLGDMTAETGRVWFDWDHPGVVLP